MGAVIDPFARCGNPLASGDRRQMPDHGDEIAVATSLDTENAKAIFFIVVRHALDEARQHFLGRAFQLRFHTECRIMCLTPRGGCLCHGTKKSLNRTPDQGLHTPFCWEWL